MKYLSIIISGIIVASFAAEEHNQSNVDNFYSENCYREGLTAIKNYESCQIIELGFNEAYLKFKCAEEMGHIGAIYHLGYLHELAALQNLYKMNVYVYENGVRLTEKEHLSKASYYYAIASQYDLPRSEEAYCRVLEYAKIMSKS